MLPFHAGESIFTISFTAPFARAFRASIRNAIVSGN